MQEEKLEDLIRENKSAFYQELKEVIQPSFDGLDNPERYRPILENIKSQAKRDSIPRQGRLVAAATEYLRNKNNSSLLVSAEMGTGKTDMAIKISMDKSYRNIVVMCPPHLVNKWADEILANYEDPQAVEIVKPKRWSDITHCSEKPAPGVTRYIIVSRESAKLEYKKVPAYNTKERKIFWYEEDEDGNDVKVEGQATKVLCPDCGSQLQEDEGVVLESLVPKKCPECDAALRKPCDKQSRKMKTRLSIGEYIKRRWPKGHIDLLIADEIHEYKGGNTGQGQALARIAAQSDKIVGLTGTLLNGYASSLFYILWRLNPRLMKDKLGLEYNQVKQFVEQFGTFEKVMKEKEKEGKTVKKGRQQKTKERPKISPFLLSMLMDMTIFLRLDEMKMQAGKDLPAYKEEVEFVPMDEDLIDPYKDYIHEIRNKVVVDQQTQFLGNLAIDSVAVADMPFMEHCAQNEVFYNPPFEREDYGLTNKEKALIKRVENELEEGRQCLVYVHFSNKGIGKDLENILNEKLDSKAVNFLPPTVPAAKREQWIKDNPCDVLICNPELVKTGLDLLEFPTIIFYETTYNVYTLKQASRRSWRIGQDKEVRVVFMGYKDTPQEIALKLIGAKINAANSLEGRLSGDDDLSSLGDDETNIQAALAKAIMQEGSNGESSSGEMELSSADTTASNREWDPFESWFLDFLEEDHDSSQEDQDKSDSYKGVVFAQSEDSDEDYHEDAAFGGLFNQSQAAKQYTKEQLETFASGKLF